MSVKRGAMPFIRAVKNHVPGRSLSALCTLSLEEDLFLHDHTLGRSIAKLDSALLSLPIVPMTVSMEIVAEAAAYLFPELQFVGMRDVRAYHWILLKEKEVQLELESEFKQTVDGFTEVEVTLQIGGSKGAPAMVGTMLLAPSRPIAPTIGSIRLHDEGHSHWQPEEIYRTGMFHGPTFQAIVDVERRGSDGCVAKMRSPGLDRFFSSTPTPSFVAEPVLLDAAGQLIGLWTLETLESGFVVFPYRLETLEFFGPTLLAGEVVTCQARCTLQEGGRVMSDIDLVDQLGALRIRLTGWEDKRFELPRELYQFILNPSDHPLSKSWEVPLAGHPQPQRYRCQRVGEWGRWGSHSEFWETVLAHLILNPRERELWDGRIGPERRRRDWLLGRVAAKEAVISLMSDHFGLTLAPADVEIATDHEGRPYVVHSQETWGLPDDVSINISIAHSDGMVVSVAGVNSASSVLPISTLGVGVDLEPKESEAENFSDIAFTADEQKLLDTLENGELECWSLRLWCAKEALGKALGCGLSGGLHNLVATQINSQDGVISMKIRGALAERFSTLADRSIQVFTAQDGKWLVASVLDTYSLRS